MIISFPASCFYYSYQLSSLLFSRKCRSHVGISKVNLFLIFHMTVKNKSELNISRDFGIHVSPDFDTVSFLATWTRSVDKVQRFSLHVTTRNRPRWNRTVSIVEFYQEYYQLLAFSFFRYWQRSKLGRFYNNFCNQHVVWTNA